MKAGKMSPQGNSSAREGLSSLRAPAVSAGWNQDRDWRLPSGQALGEFALQSGFLAPLLLDSKALHPREMKADHPATAPATTKESR